MLRRSCAREVFEDNWSQGGCVCAYVCVSVCVWDGWRERWGDRGVKEERWSDSRGDVRRLSDGKK